MYARIEAWMAPLLERQTWGVSLIAAMCDGQPWWLQCLLVSAALTGPGSL